MVLCRRTYVSAATPLGSGWRYLETLAQRLARLMFRDQLTQIGLARKAGIASNNVQAILTGHSKRPAADIILPLARALGVSPEYLVFGDDRPVTSIAEARERLGDMFMELMGLLNVAERQHPVREQLRIAEAKASYDTASRRAPVVSGRRAYEALERLRQRGALRELAPEEARLAILVELPESTRKHPKLTSCTREASMSRSASELHPWATDASRRDLTNSPR